MDVTKATDNYFTTIGKGLYLSPSRTTTPLRVDGQQAPTLILIFGWMGAKVSHLHKYTKVYEDLYPQATKILVRCEASFFWSRESKNQANLAPVVEVLEKLGYIPDRQKGTSTIPTIQPHVLVHAFSNGGCAQLMCLSRIIASRPSKTQSPGTKATSAIVFDSCPGIGRLESSKRAFTIPIRSPILRRIANIFITFMYFYTKLMRRLFGIKTWVEVLKAGLKNPRLLPWTNKDTPRLFIYSRKDDLVPSADVEAHAREEKAAGLNVQSEVFEDTAHVAHARGDPARYWGAVEKLWKDAYGPVAVGSHGPGDEKEMSV